MNRKMINTMTEQEIRDFMIILKSLNLGDATIVGIAAMMDRDIGKTQEMVEFIKKNPNITETELINKAMEIGDIL